MGNTTNTQYCSKIDKYHFQKEICTGSFGCIYLCKSSKSYSPVVIKRFLHKNVNEIIDRFSQLEEVNHSNIVPILDSFFYKEDFCIVMPFYKNGTLQNLIKESRPLPEGIIIRILHSIATVLDYLHTEKEMIHKDIKPDHIFIKNFNDFDIILGGFEFAKPIWSPFDLKSIPTCSTLKYMAPEAFTKKCDYKADIWSLGCVMYEMMTTKNEKFLKHEVCFKNFKENMRREMKNYDESLIDLVIQMLSKQPQLRPSAKDLIHFCNERLKFVQ